MLEELADSLNLSPSCSVRNWWSRQAPGPLAALSGQPKSQEANDVVSSSTNPACPWAKCPRPEKKVRGIQKVRNPRAHIWALARTVYLARTPWVLGVVGYLPVPKPMFALRLVFQVQLRAQESIKAPRPTRAKIVAKTKLDPNGRFAHRNIM